MEAMQENVWKPLSAATLNILGKLANAIFDETADCMAEETLAYLKSKFAAGAGELSPQKVSRFIRKAYETLGEKLGDADIDIILEELGELTEEKLLGKLIVTRVFDCMDDKALQWLVEEYGSYGLDMASVELVEEREDLM